MRTTHMRQCLSRWILSAVCFASGVISLRCAARRGGGTLLDGPMTSTSPLTDRCILPRSDRARGAPAVVYMGIRSPRVSVK